MSRRRAKPGAALATLFRALGGPDFQTALAAYREQGGSAQHFLDAWQGQPTLGAPRANGRAVFEDVESCLVQFAQSEPRVLLQAAVERPALLQDFAFVSALGVIQEGQATELLLQALGSKSGALRWLALRAVLARQEPRAIARLNQATRDRDGLVVFCAVVALRRHAVTADLPRLREIAAAPRTAPGTREAAFDAIEAVCLREGLPLPDGMQPRLVEVLLPSGAVPRVAHATLVEAGAPLCQGPASRVVPSPCRAVVVDLVEVDSQVVLVLRRSPA